MSSQMILNAATTVTLLKYMNLFIILYDCAWKVSPPSVLFLKSKIILQSVFPFFFPIEENV